jgi:RNA-directed DNA polymerase
MSVAVLFGFPPLTPSPPKDDSTLFAELFGTDALLDVFRANFESTTGKGVDRLNGFQFAPRAAVDMASVSKKCLNGGYRFAPYLEVLKTKGRDKPPRLIGIPTVRDRVVLRQLNQFLAAVYPERVPKNIASTYIRQIAADLKTKVPHETWVCGTDIRTFYDAIQRDRLLKVVGRRVKCAAAIKLIGHALATPTVPKNARKARRSEFKAERGVPQGLAISNILASIYMQEVDEAMKALGVAYYRYVDDVLIYGSQIAVKSAFRSLSARLIPRGLSLHALGSGKTTIEPLSKPFGYLGYVFKWPSIAVRDATMERFLQTIAAKFSDYAHNKARRLERFKYLTSARLKEIFVLELNERITGAVSEQKRYGWIAYFNEITELSLLHRLDGAIAAMFKRLPDFSHAAPPDLKRLSRAYFEMKFNPQGGYVRDYDKIVSRVEMLTFLVERGRVDPAEALTDEQIRDRFKKYKHHILAAMHSDEAVIY